MKLQKVYAEGKHAIAEAKQFAPQAILKVFTNAAGKELAQISLHRLLKRYEEFMQEYKVTPQTLLVMLAGLEDPHNVGTIIRSAAAFGAAAVLLPFEGQAPITDAVFKASAGMAFRLPLVTFEGYQQTLSDLRKRGFEVIALDHHAKQELKDAQFGTPVVLVLGNEGGGIPGAVKPLVTHSYKIAMDSKAESLNVAAAAAVALYQWSLRK